MTNKQKIHILLAESKRCFEDDDIEGAYCKFEMIESLLQGGNEMKGHIISMTEVSNYGFIKGEDNIDYFFHRHEFIGFWDDLVNDYHHAHNPNIPVTFTVMDDSERTPEDREKGKRAENIKRTDFPNQAV